MKFSAAAVLAAAVLGAQASYNDAYPASSESSAAEYPTTTAYPVSESSAEYPASTGYPVSESSSEYPASEYPASEYPATQYTTEVVTAVTTYCPEATEITYGTNTYTVTEPTTLTITDCPCTISKPIYTTSSVICNDCATSYPNGTTYAPGPTGTGSYTPTTPPTGIATAGAGKAVALTGAGLAGFVGLAALIL